MGRSWGPQSLAPGTGSACPLDQPHWWRDSREPAGAGGPLRLLQGSAGAPGGDFVRIRHSAATRLMHPGKAPPALLWEPRSCVFCSPDVDLVPRSKTSISACRRPTTVRTGTGGASPFSSLAAAAAASEFHPSPQQSVCMCVGGAQPHLSSPSSEEAVRPWDSVSPEVASAQMSIHNSRQPPPQTFPSGDCGGYSSGLFGPSLDGLEGADTSMVAWALGCCVPGQLFCLCLQGVEAGAG